MVTRIEKKKGKERKGKERKRKERIGKKIKEYIDNANIK